MNKNNSDDILSKNTYLYYLDKNRIPHESYITKKEYFNLGYSEQQKYRYVGKDMYALIDHGERETLEAPWDTPEIDNDRTKQREYFNKLLAVYDDETYAHLAAGNEMYKDCNNMYRIVETLRHSKYPSTRDMYDTVERIRKLSRDAIMNNKKLSSDRHEHTDFSLVLMGADLNSLWWKIRRLQTFNKQTSPFGYTPQK